MCDYSLESVGSRPAKVGDKLITTGFDHTLTRGFAAVEEPSVAVCLLPGTELVFERDVERDNWVNLWGTDVGSAAARFRHINEDAAQKHHDALEFSNGKLVLLTRLRQGQKATVIQLPAAEAPKDAPAPAPATEHDTESA